MVCWHFSSVSIPLNKQDGMLHATAFKKYFLAQVGAAECVGGPEESIKAANDP